MAYRSDVGRVALHLILPVAVAWVALGLGAPCVRADDPPAPPAPETPATPVPPVAPAAPAAPSAGPKLNAAELHELIGPVALYPDVVLASLLPATAYPLQIVAAARWLRAQPQGKPVEPPASAAWDENVKALLQLPDVLYWLDENIEWVGQVGYAMATQHADVLAAVQAFRVEAEKAGNLKSDDKVKVGTQAPPTGQGAPVPPEGATAPIVIEPADPGVIYIPVYEPTMVVVQQPAPCIGWGLGYTFGLGTYWLSSRIYWPWYAGGGWGYGGIWAYPTPYYWGAGYYGWGYGHPGPWHPPHYYHGGHGGYGYGAVHNVGVRRPGAAAWQLQSGAIGVRGPGGGRGSGIGTPGTRVSGAAGLRQPTLRAGQSVRMGTGGPGSGGAGSGGLGVPGVRTPGGAHLQPSRSAPGLVTQPGGTRFGRVGGRTLGTMAGATSGATALPSRSFANPGVRSAPATGLRGPSASAYRSSLLNSYPSATHFRSAPQRSMGTYTGPSGYVPRGTSTTGGYRTSGYSSGGYAPSRSMSGYSGGARGYSPSFSGGGGYSGRGYSSAGSRSMGGMSHGGSRSSGGGRGGGRR